MNNVRGIWVAIFATAGLVVAALAGALFWLGGLHPALAVAAGVGAGAGFVGLALTVANFVMRPES
ncbi:hypothetical protein [Nonomuraea endophytica]|uniref:hypothetical protein n=1 Tax=Nonomuraea endophytica TaxID=714136 RepID=UPI0037C88D33